MDIVLPQPSPIDILPDDILDYIFLLNTLKCLMYVDPYRFDDDDDDDMGFVEDIDGWTRFPQNPVSVARATSQVCRRWRIIILTSMRLWARLLNTSYFPPPQKSTTWWNVVVGRAGPAAPIWLTSANVAYFSEEGDQAIITEYLLPILDTHRMRIEKIDLRLRLEGGLESDVRWRALLNIGCTAQEVILSMTPFPNLISTVIPEQKASRFLQSPLRHIKALTLSAPLWGRDVSTILPHVQQLRRLGLWNLYEEKSTELTVSAPYSHSPPTRVPFLEELFISDMLPDIVHLLPRIIPAPGCKLMISAEHIPQDLAPGRSHALNDFVNALGSYIQGVLTKPVQPCTVLQLKSSLRSLRLDADPTWVRVPEHSDNGFWPGDHLVNALILRIEDDTVPVPEWLTQAVLHALSTCKAPSLKDLALSWDSSEDFISSIPSFSQFLYSLTSLKTLRIGTNIVASIVDLAARGAMARAANPPVLFPSLQTLETSVDMNHTIYAQDIARINTFIFWRTWAGLPFNLVVKAGVLRARVQAEFGRWIGHGLVSVKAVG